MAHTFSCDDCAIPRCRYKSKGNALLAALTAAFPDRSVTIAAGAPKRGSFDILVVADGTSM
jgi:hypothetical protein